MKKNKQSRLESLYIFEGIKQELLDNWTLIASQICQSPIALISFIDQDRQWIKSKFGLDLSELPSTQSFCALTIQTPSQALEVSDARLDVRFQEFPLVKGELGVRHYAGFTLVDSTHHVLGTLCVMDKAPKTLTHTQLKAMQVLARQVVEALETSVDSNMNQKPERSIPSIQAPKEGEYFKLYHYAPDLMASIDPKTRQIVKCNLAICQTLGYTQQELLGQDVSRLYHPESMEQAKLTIQGLMEKGYLKGRRLELLTKDKKRIPVSLNISVIRDEHGDVMYSNSVLREISDVIEIEAELKHLNKNLELEVQKRTKELLVTREFLKKVTEIAPSVIYVFNQETNQNEYANKQIGEMIGYSSQEIQELGSAMMAQICHPDDLPGVLHHFGQIKALKTGQSVSIEYRMKHKNGNYKWFLSDDTVFERNEAGEVIKHLGVATDITGLKEAQARLTEQASQLKTQNEELRQLTHIATHDLKSPILAFNGHFEYVLDNFKTSNPELNLSLDCMKEEFAKLSDIIKGLDEVLVSKELKSQIQTIDLNAVVSEIVENHHQEIKAIGGEVKMNLSPRCFVSTSKPHVEGILNKLVSNAIKYYSKDRKLLIEMTTTTSNNQIELVIKDNGLGIDLDLQRNRMFKMFTRFHTHRQGTGLGLHLAQHMLEKIGGSIKVQSQVGTGTTIKIQLKDQK